MRYLDGIEKYRVLIPALVLLTGGFLIATQVLQLSDPVRIWIVDLTWMIAAAVAGWRSLLTASRGAGADRFAFLMFGIGSLCWAVGMVIWNYLELVHRIVTPFPSPADFAFLSAAPFYAAGLVAYQPPAPRPGRFVVRVASFGVIACALAASLLIYLYDAFLESPHGAVYHTTALLWPIMYGGAAAFGLFALTADLWGPRFRVLLLLVAAILIHAFGSLLYAEQLLLSTFATGGMIDVLWVIAFATEYVAAVEQDRTGRKAPVAVSTRGNVLHPPEIVLPPLAIGLVLLAAWMNRDAFDSRLVTLLVPLGLVFVLFIAVRGAWVYRVTALVRTAEESMYHAGRLEAVSRLTGGIAHEFNNLLTVIVGNAETLKERAEREGLTSPLSDAILAAAQRCATLTGRLMSFAQLQMLRPEPVNLGSLIEATTARFRRATRTNVSFATVAQEPALRVFMDSRQLELALVELVSNAVEAMPEGGTVHIRWKSVELPRKAGGNDMSLREGSYTELSIADSGRGMSEEEIQRVFDPFVTHKPFGVGAGLGLSVVRGFVRQSGGDLRIVSSPHRGTTITLWLPRAKADAAAESSAASLV